MTQTLIGPIHLQIGGYIVNFLGDSAVTKIDKTVKGSIRRIVSHQTSNAVVSMIVIERIGIDNKMSLSDEIEMFLDEYELEQDQDEQLCLPKSVIDKTIVFDKYIGAPKDPSYCGIVARSNGAIILLFIIRGGAGISTMVYDDLESCIAISRV